MESGGVMRDTLPLSLYCSFSLQHSMLEKIGEATRQTVKHAAPGLLEELMASV